MRDAIKSLIAADVPLLLWGPPGTGKTAAISALAASAGAHFETLIGSTLDPTDIARPVLRKGEVELSTAPWARRIRRALDRGQPAWLFLDELTCSPPSVQAALLRVINERRVAELSLAGCRIIAAANASEHAADHYDLSAATANRWAHLDWRVDADEWCAGEMAGWGAPDERLQASRGRVCAYIQVNRSALLDPPKETATTLRGWPSPRSWSHVARIPDATHEIVSALIGAPAAVEFAAWRERADLPDPEALLTGRATLPDRGDRARAALLSCVSLAVSRPALLPALWATCLRARKDVAVAAARVGVRSARAAALEIDMSPELAKLVSITRGVE